MSTHVLDVAVVANGTKSSKYQQYVSRFRPDRIYVETLRVHWIYILPVKICKA